MVCRIVVWCDEPYFQSVHAGAELDLLIQQTGRNLGFEFKLTRSPKLHNHRPPQ